MMARRVAEALSAAPDAMRLGVLAACFLLHNLEEVVRFSRWTTGGVFHPGVDRETFVAAVLLLSIGIVWTLALAARAAMQGFWGWCAAIIAGGLLVNATIHAAQSLLERSHAPGVYTALLLLAPASIWVLAAFNRQAKRSWRTRMAAVCLGGAAIPIMAGLALELADALVLLSSK